MAARFDSIDHTTGDHVAGFVACLDGGYAWRWQWTYWPTAGASRTW